MKMKKLISTGLSVLLAASLLAGCGSGKAPAASSEPATEKAGTESEAAGDTGETTADKGNTSDEVVTLKWYMSINPVAPDTDKVIEKLNEYTREKIGVEINFHLKDKRLSLKAKGLLSQMLSLPDDWDYTLSGLSYINRESKDAIRSAVNELETAGYIRRRQTTDASGKFAANEYTIFERPIEGEPMLDKPSSENPITVNPSAVNPLPENPTQLNTKKSNTQKQNTHGSILLSLFSQVKSQGFRNPSWPQRSVHGRCQSLSGTPCLLDRLIHVYSYVNLLSFCYLPSSYHLELTSSQEVFIVPLSFLYRPSHKLSSTSHHSPQLIGRHKKCMTHPPVHHAFYFSTIHFFPFHMPASQQVSP